MVSKHSATASAVAALLTLGLLGCGDSSTASNAKETKASEVSTNLDTLTPEQKEHFLKNKDVNPNSDPSEEAAAAAKAASKR